MDDECGTETVEACPRVAIRPRPGPGATRAGAAVDTPVGRIAVEWATADGAAFELCVDLPPGVTADVALPDGTAATAAGGFSRFVTGLP